MTIDTTLEERGARYGDFTDHANIAQALQDVMRFSPSALVGWMRLSTVQKQALTVIADKIARILSGDPDYADNWHDIQGYAKLVEDRLIIMDKVRKGEIGIAIEPELLTRGFVEPAAAIDDDSPRQQAIGQNGNDGLIYCECHACIRDKDLKGHGAIGLPLSATKMILCPTCGNKRCPHASDHRLACTGSNEPGQAGSIYPATPVLQDADGLKEPGRPRHLCMSCALGHATHECKAGAGGER